MTPAEFDAKLASELRAANEMRAAINAKYIAAGFTERDARVCNHIDDADRHIRVLRETRADIAALFKEAGLPAWFAASCPSLKDARKEVARHLATKGEALTVVRAGDTSSLVVAPAGTADTTADHTWIDSRDLRPQPQPAPKPERIPYIEIGQALDELVKMSALPVYPGPFATVNEAIGFGGMLGGQVYTLPSGTGRGKTSMANQYARHHGATGRVLIDFYEAFAGYNVARMAAGPVGVSSNAIIRDAEKHGAAVLKALPVNIVLLDRPGLELMRAAIDDLSQKAGKPPFVIVDYMQKVADQIQASQARPDPRLAASQASDAILRMADETKAPFLVVSATSRVNNKRSQDPRRLAPYELVDVAKESGQIEYDSGAMMVLSLSDEHDGDERIGTLTIAKARFGEECHIDMRYNGRTGEWRDLGRVERETRKKAIEAPLRDRVLGALRLGRVESATALAKALKKNKRDVLAMVRELESEGLVSTADGLEVVE